MRETMLIALRATAATLLLTGIAYPLAFTGVAQAVFPSLANGSLLKNDKGQVVGSALLAQGTSSAAYFQPRPSAAGEKGYDAQASSGSNLGVTSAKLGGRVADEARRLSAENPGAGPVPAELVTTSGSGLDPHLSPGAMYWQLPRVAKVRGVAPERVRALVDEAVEGRDLGFLGEPRVNVLLVNLALDRQFGRPTTPAAPAAAAPTPAAPSGP